MELHYYATEGDEKTTRQKVVILNSISLQSLSRLEKACHG